MSKTSSHGCCATYPLYNVVNWHLIEDSKDALTLFIVYIVLLIPTILYDVNIHQIFTNNAVKIVCYIKIYITTNRMFFFFFTLYRNSVIRYRRASLVLLNQSRFKNLSN